LKLLPELVLSTLVLCTATGTLNAGDSDDWQLGASQSPSDSGRRLLDASFLFGTSDMAEPVSTIEFEPAVFLTGPADDLVGRIVIATPGQFAHSMALKDDFSRLTDPTIGLRHLPPLDARVVQDGGDIIPVKRIPHTGDHPYWEWILSPGRSWLEPGDEGYSRAVIPFSLQQRNQNCTHYGLLTFLYRSDGASSRAYYQVSSETCIWLKADLWGTLDIRFIPNRSNDDAEIIRLYQNETANRLPAEPIEMLGTQYSSISIEHFRPVQPEDATIWGLVKDGTHYIGGCETRHGRHPFCETLVLPSYSIAKSVFTGLGYLQLKHRFPDLASQKVIDWVPECRLADERWEDVELKHLVDMTTGLYDSAGYMEDENVITHTPFIQGETHREKLTFACQAYERHDPPGKEWVYHTSDSYLAGLLMARYLREHLGAGADLFHEVFLETILSRLDLSPASRFTRRTYDHVAQPFSGYGLSFYPDDIARLALWLNGPASVASDLFLTDQYKEVMRHRERMPKTTLAPSGLDYRFGFWAAEASSWTGCTEKIWIPFLSGFGGITVALLPNGMVYYYFSDSGIFKWAQPVIEAHKIRSICEH
jgi:hypothetical protein